MASLLPGFEYDIFISYRHNDNHAGWVTEFVKNLRDELSATIKSPVSVYFDSNPHDGLQESHNVDKSLEGKLKCVIFIPILSHTYCDTRSFAWNNEFLVFCKQAKSDSLGLDVHLTNRNVTSRILPVQIHEIDNRDQSVFEKEISSPLRSISFIFKSNGVNRPLTPTDNRTDNQNKTYYHDQLNKTANTIEQIFDALTITEATPKATLDHQHEKKITPQEKIPWIWNELVRRNVFRAVFVYILVALLVHQFLLFLVPYLKLEERYINIINYTLLTGSVLASIFAWLYEFSPQGFIRTNSPQATVNTFPPHKKKPLTNKPLVTVLVVALILQYLYFTNVKPSILNGNISNENEVISIAVLPFENRSENPKDKYIADGITDDIINRLTIISKFKVTNRGKSQQYEGKILPLNDVADELGVSVLLTGSIERHENKIVVRAHIIDSKDTYLWGDTFHRTTENIVAVQSEIAQVIADKLKVELNEKEKARLHLKATDNPTAYDYYLRGRSLYYQYRLAANDSAIIQFKNAIALDPNYARAWAGLGDSYAQIHGRFAGEFAWTDSSIVASTRAIQLDSNLSEGYKALAAAYNYREDYDKALPLLLKSVELNPTNDQAVGNLGTTYLLMGDLAMAVQWQKKGVGMNPKNWIPYQLIGWIYRLLGDLESAESWLLKSMELNPDAYDTYELLGYTYVTQGRIKAALNLIPRVMEIGLTDPRVPETAGLIAHFAGDHVSAKKYFQLSIDNNPKYKDDRNTVSPLGLGQILLQEGNKVEAEVYLSHAMENNLAEIRNGSKSFDPPFYIASIYAIRGNKEQSLIWLQKAIDLNWVDYAKILYGPYFTKYKNDSDFLKKVELVRKKTDAMLLKANEY